MQLFRILSVSRHIETIFVDVVATVEEVRVGHPVVKFVRVVSSMIPFLSSMSTESVKLKIHRLENGPI